MSTGAGLPPLQKDAKTVMHITAVSDNVEKAWGPEERLERSRYFASLLGLVTDNCAEPLCSVACEEPPTGTGPVRPPMTNTGCCQQANWSALGRSLYHF